MTEHRVARVDELRPGERKVVSLGRLQIGLFRIGDEYYALPNICPHQFGPLCQGKLGGAVVATADTGWRPEWFYDGEVVTCPWHGLEFRVPTGRCLALPKVRLRRYPVKIEGDDVKLVL
ncbi:MAG TPA: Rieske 2Fe-2S domain-containing protein [Chloroflexota bacterium]